jgi:hypothetical protein
MASRDDIAETPMRTLVEETMSEKRRTYENFVIGLLTGVGVAALFTWQLVKERDACEPVVDVEYRKVGRESFPQTVIRRPVRDGNRCVLAEANA